MSFDLFSALVPPCQKMLGNMVALLSKAEAYCADQMIAPEELIQARIAPDMLPFAYQVKSTTVHSLGAIEGVRRGSFSPDTTVPGESFAALREQLEATIGALSMLDPAEINGFVGRPMRFEIKSYHADFTADMFLLTFSLPNFYFHAATAYDILRMKRLPIGKVDYLGALPLKR